METRRGGLGIDGAQARESIREASLQNVSSIAYARPEILVMGLTPATGLGYCMTSIVILTHNQLDFTQLCLASIQRLTDEPYELIVVDNASTDGTVDYLRMIPGLRLIRNAANRGFPAAVNQGIAVAKGRQVLLLNNDTVVTAGWLRRMLDCLYSDPRIGLVGPCTNHTSGDQQVASPYEGAAALERFAADWGQIHRGEVDDTTRLIGFCYLIRREVIDTIGGMDERFGLGCFEDDDYTLRAIVAGFRAVIARDAFIHHFGGRTFAASCVDFMDHMKENQMRFLNKWSAYPDVTKAYSGPIG